MNATTLRPVVVGIDGSAESSGAARYGAWEADRRRTGLKLVCIHWPPPVWGPADAYLWDVDAVQEWFEERLRILKKELADIYPHLYVETRTLVGLPASVLVDESARAGLVVLGTTAEGGFKGRLAGSVAAQVAAHSQVPVVVIRPANEADVEPEQFAGKRVVVGIDGSPESARALAFGVEQAMARRAPLEAVFVWGIPSIEKEWTPFEPTRYDPRDVFDAAERMLAEATAGWGERFPDLVLTRRCINALDVVEALAEAASDAGLIVVGSRGHGGFLDLRLGSTVDGLIRHSPVPVAVVRGRVES